jgi:hypothetical protein
MIKHPYLSEWVMEDEQIEKDIISPATTINTKVNLVGQGVH